MFFKINDIIMRNIEYKMPTAFGKNLLKNRKGEEAKMKPNDYLCKYVNEQYNLKGLCTKVIFY